MQLLINLIKEFAFNYVLFIFSSKYAYVVPLKNKKGITITNAFQKILDEWNCKQTKYGWIKEVNFTVDQRNHGFRIMIQKCIQHIVKEILLLLKDLLKP